jgi:hypothetical protein
MNNYAICTCGISSSTSKGGTTGPDPQRNNVPIYINIYIHTYIYIYVYIYIYLTSGVTNFILYIYVKHTEPALNKYVPFMVRKAVWRSPAAT